MVPISSQNGTSSRSRRGKKKGGKRRERAPVREDGESGIFLEMGSWLPRAPHQRPPCTDRSICGGGRAISAEMTVYIAGCHTDYCVAAKGGCVCVWGGGEWNIYPGKPAVGSARDKTGASERKETRCDTRRRRGKKQRLFSLPQVFLPFCSFSPLIESRLIRWNSPTNCGVRASLRRVRLSRFAGAPCGIASQPRGPEHQRQDGKDRQHTHNWGWLLVGGRTQGRKQQRKR